MTMGETRRSRSMQTIEINGPKGVDSRWTRVSLGLPAGTSGETQRGRKRRREKKVGVECPGSIYNKAGVISTG